MNVYIKAVLSVLDPVHFTVSWPLPPLYVATLDMIALFFSAQLSLPLSFLHMFYHLTFLVV